jgi:hypothetical protein
MVKTLQSKSEGLPEYAGVCPKESGQVIPIPRMKTRVRWHTSEEIEGRESQPSINKTIMTYFYRNVLEVFKTLHLTFIATGITL